jgi:exodeoxyribonuclease VII large subunit
MTRGGGSLEELMSFNDERVVRALYASRIPTLVAIGHERDLTFAEEVADVRGSTPTDCARRLVPDRIDVLYEIAQAEQGILERFQRSLTFYQERIERVVVQAEHWMQQLSSKALYLVERVDRGLTLWLNQWQDRVLNFSRLLESYNPTAVLQRGYVLIYDADGRPCVETASLTPGQRVTLELRDGKKQATIDGKLEQPTLL